MTKKNPNKKSHKLLWGTVTFIILIVMVVSCSSGGGSDSNGGKQENSSTKSTTKKPDFYKVGDTVTVGDVTYTLNSVQAVSERNEFEDENPKYVIKVTCHVKNNFDKDLPIGTDLDAYGYDNKKLNTYPVNNITLDSIASGKEADVVAGFGADSLNEIELQFKPFISTHKAAKFKVAAKDITKDDSSFESSSSDTESTDNESSSEVDINSESAD